MLLKKVTENEIKMKEEDIKLEFVQRTLQTVTNDDIKKGSFVVPPNIKKISLLAFYHLEKLKYLDLGMVEEIGNLAFANCYNLESIKWSDNLRIIGDLAFAKIKVTNLILPKSIQFLGDKCFYASKVQTANINNAHADKSLFKNCQSLTNVYGTTNQKFIISDEVFIESQTNA